MISSSSSSGNSREHRNSHKEVKVIWTCQRCVSLLGVECMSARARKNSSTRNTYECSVVVFVVWAHANAPHELCVCVLFAQNDVHVEDRLRFARDDSRASSYVNSKLFDATCAHPLARALTQSARFADPSGARLPV